MKCENCFTDVNVLSMSKFGDSYLCSNCYSIWLNIFQSCDHNWEKLTDGTAVCRKCDGIISDKARQELEDELVKSCLSLPT
jgi:hypothetical protein